MNAIAPISESATTLCTIHLHGFLRENFGESITVPGSTVSVAVRNMLLKKPRMVQALEHGEYRVHRGNLNGGIDLDETQLQMRVGPARQIHLFPHARGAGGNHGGVLKIVLGVVLVAAAVVTGGAAAAGEAGIFGLSSSTAFQLAGTIGLFGAALILQGISRLISPQPGLGASYLLNGNLNTAQQGIPVPLCYGVSRVGSIVVASAYSAEDYTTGSSDYEGAGSYVNASGGFSGYLDAFDTGNPLPSGASGKGGGGKAGGSGGIEAPNTLESKAIVSLVDVISEGPITGLVGGPQGIFFNNTPLANADGSWNFRGVTFTYLFGTPDQQAVPGFPSATEDVAIDQQCFYGNPLIQQLQSTTATSARVTVELPALYATNTQNGDINPSAVSLMIEVAEVIGTDVGSYSQVISDVINGKCTSPYQKSYVFALPGAGGTSPVTAWNIRLTKLTQESAVSTTINQLFWYSYDLITDNLIGYEDSACVLLQIDSEAFGSTLPARTYLVEGITVQVPLNYNVTTRVYATSGPGTSGGSWDYASFQPETTSNPAWILYDFVSNNRYGLGVSTQNLETLAVQLYEIAQYCDGLVPDGNGGAEPRYTLNGCLNQRATAFQIMQAIAATFRGQVYWAGGQVCVTCDMPQAPVKIYSAANVIGGNFVYQGSSLKTRHTMVNSHFTDPSNQYLPGVEPTELPDQIANRGIVCTDILGFGVTSRGLAHRLGNWLLYTENFQTETVTFSVSWDSAGVMPGQLIQVADPNILGIRMGGRLRGGSSINQLALDMEFSPVDGQIYSASCILQDGSLAETIEVAGFSTSTDVVTGTTYTIATLASPLPLPPLPQAMFILQDANSPATEWQVVGITETGRGIFEIIAAQYNPDKFELVEDVPTLEIPVFSTVPSQLASALQPPSNVSAITTLAGQGLTTITMTTVSWQCPVDARVVQYQISVVNAEGTTVDVLVATGSSASIDNLPPSTYYFAVRSLGTNGSTSSWAYSSPLVVSGTSNNIPPSPTDLTASAGFNSVQLRWVASAQQDVLYYNVWRSDTIIAPHQPVSLAALIGTTSGTAFADVDSGILQPGTTWNYWVEPVTTTGVVGGLSAPASCEISYISPGYFTTSILPGWVTSIQPVGTWDGASLPANPAAADGATTIYWAVNGQLYSWNETLEQFIAATPTPATLAPGQLNPNITIPGSQLTGTIIASQVAGALTNANLSTGQLTGAITPAQLSFTDPSNICLNPVFTVSGSASSAGWSSGIAALPSTTSGVPSNPPTANLGAQTVDTVTFGSPFTVSAGGAYYLSGWAGGSSANAASIGLTFTDANGNHPTFVSAASTTPSSTWDLMSGQVEVPATIGTSSVPANAQITLSLGSATAPLPPVYWSQITCRVAVSTALVVPNAITAAQIASINAAVIQGTITSTQIGANAITSSQIAANAVTANAIAAGSIVAASLAANSVTAGAIAANAVTANEIAANAVTTGALAAGAVTAATIASGTITATQIQSGTITGAQISGNTVTASNIAAATIVGYNIAANTISGNMIESATILAGNIGAGTIQVSNLAAGTLNASNITSGVLNSGVVIGSLANFGSVQITNAQIANLTVGTSNMAYNAITSPSNASLGSQSSATASATGSLSVTVPTNSYVLMFLTVNGFSMNGASGGSSGGDGGNDYGGSGNFISGVFSRSGSNLGSVQTPTGGTCSATVAAYDGPGTGTFTYSFTAYFNGGGVAAGGTYNATLTAIVIQR
jgi:predicted phage tail protein